MQVNGNFPIFSRIYISTVFNEYWSMDFIHDQLKSGRGYHLLNIINDFNYDGLDLSLTSIRN